MGLGGLLLLGFGSSVHEVLNWVWPPALLALVVWMVVRAHRQLRSRTGRWLLYPVIAMLALAAIGGGYETVREAVDATAYPMPGQLIDVGGHRLHLNCTGSGSPTVVLEPGARRDVVEPRLDHAGRRPRHPGLRLRPRRSRLERARRHPPGRRPDRDRPAHAAAARDTFPDPTCWPAIPSAASTCSPSPPATPTRSPAWCWWTPPHRHRPRHRRPHRRRRELLRRHGPRLRAGLDLRSTRSGPPVRPPRLRQPAAAVAGRGARQHRDRRQPAQHDRRVRPGVSLGAASRSPAGLRRQAAGRPDRRQSETTPPGRRRRTTWPPCRPTACTASSTAPPTKRWSRTRNTPPPPRKRSSRSSPRSEVEGR